MAGVERPLEPTFLIDPALARMGRGEGPWTCTEIRPDLGALDPSLVRVDAYFLDRWAPTAGAVPGARIGISVDGLPEDVLFVDVAREESRVEWSDGSRGRVSSLVSCRRLGRRHCLFVLAPAPQGELSLRGMHLVLDVHRVTRKFRAVANLGAGEAAVLQEEERTTRWMLSADREVAVLTSAGGWGDGKAGPALEIPDGKRIRLTDGDGGALKEEGACGARGWSESRYRFRSAAAEAAGLRVMVEAPLGTEVTRLEVNLEAALPEPMPGGGPGLGSPAR